MYTYHDTLPLLAALVCALCNGGAAVLQKTSADREEVASSLDAGLLWRLFKYKAYFLGSVLDILGWVLTLYAVHYLPLFLVEAVIAANVAVTALIERLFYARKMPVRAYLAIAVIIAGLVFIALSSSPGKAGSVSRSVLWVIVGSPLLIAGLGFLLARSRKYGTSIGLAVLGGLAFGDTSILGRIFSFSRPLWHTLYNPLVLAIIVSGILGILLFSMALQRTQATVVNATMTASQTLIPAIVGLGLLGDKIRQGMILWFIFGAIAALGGLGLFTQTYKAPHEQGCRDV